MLPRKFATTAAGIAVTASLAVPMTATVAQDGSPSPDPACAGQSVSFLLSFIPNVQHAGFLVAQARGYYDAEGLTVSISPASETVNVTQAVGDGSVNLGQIDYVDIVESRLAGVPVKAVAQTYKDPFFFWYTSKASGIDTVAEWEGKRVGAIQGSDYPERDAMMLAADADPTTLIPVEQEFDGVLDETTMDIAEGVVFFHPALMVGAMGLPFPDDYNVFWPAELGADFASQTVAANEDYLTANGPVVTCFLRASIKGWQDAFADPAAAVTDVMTFIPEGAIPESHQQAAIADVLPIVGTGADDPTLLQPDPANYQATIDQLVSLAYIDEAVDVATTYDASFYDAAVATP